MKPYNGSVRHRALVVGTFWAVSVIKVGLLVVAVVYLFTMFTLPTASDTQEEPNQKGPREVAQSDTNGGFLMVSDGRPAARQKTAVKDGDSWLLVPPSGHPGLPEPQIHANPQENEASDKARHSGIVDGMNDDVFNDGIPKVLLIAYYRGGSSIMGKLFDLYPNTNKPEGFYWFEPLMGVYSNYFKTRKSKRSPVYNGYIVKGSKPDSEATRMTQLALNVTENIFTCNVQSLPANDILLHFLVTETTTSRLISMHYRECLKSSEHSNLTKVKLLSRCVPKLQTACKSAYFRAIKTIRMSLKLVTPLLDKFPDLRIIFSTRDPRGILLSRKLLEASYYTNDKTLAERSKELCEQMRQDLDQAEVLKRRFSTRNDRFFMTQYERLALDTVSTTSKIYQFLGWVFPEGLKEWLLRATHLAGEPSNVQTSVHRNATKVTSRWRHDLTGAQQKIITSHCRDVLERLNYTTDV